MITNSIKNIILDFGGVIINIDPSKTLDAFIDLMGKGNSKELNVKIIEDELYQYIETGRITPQQFREGLKELMNIDADDKQIDNAWNALIMDIPPERIKIIEEVSNNYRIFLLSNSNIIHYRKYRSDFEKEFGYKTFSDLFEKAYFSHEIGYRKPDSRIYNYVLRKQKLNPRETLFIDDSLVNIEAAKELNILSYHLKDEEINDLFYEGKLTVSLNDLI